jgi:uncharacterized protein (TIGR03435 family)
MRRSRYSWKMRTGMVMAMLVFAGASFGQGPTFEVASVKASPQTAGRDARGRIVAASGRVNARNVSLRDLIVEAYHIGAYQVSGGPRWLDSDEFDIDARAGGAANREELDLMLRALLADRFHLKVHRETRDLRVYALVVDRRGPKIQPAKEGESAAGRPSARRFHGDMRQLAGLLAVQLSIPASSDPTRPSMAAETPTPVVDETGLSGTYDFAVEFGSDPGGDMFAHWQRILQEQLGLRLDSRKGPVEILIVDGADRIPTAN